MGKIKISENRIILKKEGTVEVYVKTFDLSCNSWIVYNGYIFQLESIDEDQD